MRNLKVAATLNPKIIDLVVVGFSLRKTSRNLKVAATRKK